MNPKRRVRKITNNFQKADDVLTIYCPQETLHTELQMLTPKMQTSDQHQNRKADQSLQKAQEPKSFGTVFKDR